MTQIAETQIRNITGTPIAPILADRWSPRGFDASHEISRDDLLSIVEAARWAPSAGNTQPWAFIAARRGTPEFNTIAGSLAGFNSAWAGRASALIVFATIPARGQKMARWNEYDLGQAAASATVQAEYLGLRVHQMGGFDANVIREGLELSDDVNPLTVMAIGAYDDSDSVPAEIAQRDLADRRRLPLEQVVLVSF
ncbi:nitroreductase family protein [Propionimicrobium sp. PCR01-08-3]|uniref:nitroreductase family protein n=1 Tax=Propionimicrobium sp. PCR01-08-3 TaxID=3052086 RepID=UPI00255CE4FC|nr:nitroreductase family protein [Propionimicrobium sp. PCR01-08-3]WIY82983.1 nitroreductase family protein [Propionimicrobium sp. PCR01-08-3]